MAYEEIENTNEYIETHYYKSPHFTNTIHVLFNKFWLDYADYLLNRSETSQFLSSNFTKNYMNDRASFFALILLDLPFKTSKHQIKTNEGRGVDIKFANNAIVFTKEVRETAVEIKNDIMVTHRYV